MKRQNGNKLIAQFNATDLFEQLNAHKYNLEQLYARDVIQGNFLNNYQFSVTFNKTPILHSHGLLRTQQFSTTNLLQDLKINILKIRIMGSESEPEQQVHQLLSPLRSNMFLLQSKNWDLPVDFKLEHSMSTQKLESFRESVIPGNLQESANEAKAEQTICRSISKNELNMIEIMLKKLQLDESDEHITPEIKKTPKLKKVLGPLKFGRKK